MLSLNYSAVLFLIMIICNMQRPTVEVTGHKAHGPVPQPGSVVIVRVNIYLWLRLCVF